MNRILVRAAVFVVVSATIVLSVREAQSGPVLPTTGATGAGAGITGGTAGASSTVLAPLLTLGTIGAIIFFIVRSNNDKADAGTAKSPAVVRMTHEEAATLAQLYLNSSANQLSLDVAAGQGASLNDLATLLAIPEANRPAFDQLLHAHSEEILSLMGADALRSDSAPKLFTRIGEWMAADAALAPHHAWLKASAG